MPPFLRIVNTRLRAVVLLLALAGCAAWSVSAQQGSAPLCPCPSQADGASAGVPNLWQDQRQIDSYIDSGRYESDVAAVTLKAQQWVEQRRAAATKPAIVLDIDETALSNWPAYRINGWGRVVNGPCDLQQGPCGLRVWQAMGQLKALQPTLTLARRARELGVAVFFITGRPDNLREASERNLREQGYEFAAVVLEPAGTKYASAADFKAPERRRLTEQGYTILLSMGDQESDLSGGYAERTFKLPNPVYFLP
jgi:predicted secreted acid phosphatase